jgi:hypothetical protein
MHTHLRFATARTLIAILLCSTALFSAQTAPVGGQVPLAAQTAPTADELVELAPFTVSADGAQSTRAGLYRVRAELASILREKKEPGVSNCIAGHSGPDKDLRVTSNARTRIASTDRSTPRTRWT